MFGYSFSNPNLWSVGFHFLNNHVGRHIMTIFHQDDKSQDSSGSNCEKKKWLEGA